MAQINFTPIQLYRSGTASAVPTAANLALGELALNYRDGRLYYEDNAGVVQIIGIKFSAAAAAFLSTPTSANLAALVTDETGSGPLVFATSPSIATPNITSASGDAQSLTCNNTSTLATAVQAAQFQMINNPATPAAGVTGVNAIGRTAGAQTFTNVTGVIGQGYTQGSGNVTNLFGTRGTCLHQASGGVVASASALQASATYLGSGYTVTNAYGVRIEPQFNATFTASAWGLFQTGPSDRNYMQGRLLLNTLSDDAVNQLQCAGGAEILTAADNVGGFTPTNGSGLSLIDTDNNLGSGGALMFGNRVGGASIRWAGIKGILINGGGGGSGHLAFSTRNNIADATLTEWMRLLNNGRLLVNTTTDDGVSQLQVAGSGLFTNNNNAVTGGLQVINTNNGTSSVSTIQINAGSTTAALNQIGSVAPGVTDAGILGTYGPADSAFVRSGANATGGFSINIGNNTATASFRVRMGNTERLQLINTGYLKVSNTGTYGSVAGVADLSANASHLFQSDQNAATVTSINGNTGSSVRGFLSFLPTGSTGSHVLGSLNNATVFEVRANGTVNIGNSPITEDLDVNGTNATVYTPTSASLSAPAGVVTSIRNASLTNGGYTGISFNPLYAAGSTSVSYIGAFSNAGNTAATTVFGRRTASSAYTEDMRISPAGNLLLGRTTDTTEKLQVEGTALFTGSVAINGASLTTTSTTQNLFNTVATTMNFAGASTALAIGATTGTITLRNPTIVGANATQNLFNTIATTVNFAGAATAINMGAATGTTTVNNKLSAKGTFTPRTNLGTTNSITLDGNSSNVFQATITGAATVALPTDAGDGQTITLRVVNSAGTSQNVVFNAGYLMPNGVKTFALSAGQTLLASIANMGGTFVATVANNLS